MNWASVDDIDRTSKMLLDAGKAKNPDEARRFLQGLVLQIAVGPEVTTDETAQAALATLVNAGSRAYLGGVHVFLDADPTLTAGWTKGQTASQMIVRYGGEIVSRLTEDHPTLAIGSPSLVIGKPALHLTWRGWSGGVVQSAQEVLHGEAGVVPAGIAAAALGISETFQRQLGAVVPGRRDVGMSLWQPDVDWRTADAGPALQFLPGAVWLLGLGHLGQAYAWTLGMLPYVDPAEAQVALMDFDVTVKGNIATQLLADATAIGRKKTRVVAEALERLGFTTRIVERAYDEHFHAATSASPARDEPTVALAGFDDLAPRRLLGGRGFTRVLDAGLGAGHIEYLDMVIHSFLATDDPARAFAADPRPRRPLPAVYEAGIARQTTSGIDETTARCGMLNIAGVTVGAAFVGTFASTLVVSDILRNLHNGARYEVVSVDLRDPTAVRAVQSQTADEPGGILYTAAR